MKGGADITDQLEIKRCVEAGETDVTAIAASLNIPVEVCQSFYDWFSAKNLITPVLKESKPKPAGSLKQKAEKLFNFDE